MQEELLYQYWHYYALRKKEICLNGGLRLRILSEGHLNRQRGPDIRFARFSLNDTVYQGDVEFHLSTDDWYRHGHHLDSAYANVLLHLVAQGVAAPVSHQLSGETIPSYIFPIPERSNNAAPASLDCLPGKISRQGLQDALRNMAVQRMEFKIRRYRAALENSTSESLFYEEFFDALGFSRNRLPFRRLSLIMPLAFVRSILKSGSEPAVLLTALYFGQAGFLSPYDSDSFTKSLWQKYKQHRFLMQSVPLPAENWDFHLVRVQNHPHFRLAAWIAMLNHSKPRFPWEELSQILRERRDFSLLQEALFKFFDIDADGYWQDHYALNKALKQRRNIKYFGKERIIEIMINVVLPLMSALAREEGSHGFSDYLREFYLWLPGDLHYGIISRSMPWYSSYTKLLSRPALLQAMLYLNENYCRDYSCRACPLKRIPSSNAAVSKDAPQRPGVPAVQIAGS